VHRRPLPRCVNQCQYPCRVAVHLVDQAIVLMGDEFQRTGDYPPIGLSEDAPLALMPPG